MSSFPDWLNNQLPCFSCCKQIWFPKTATFGDGCPGLVAYLPLFLSVLIFVGRYALRPFWRRRPVWLRGFATEEDVHGLRNGRLPPSDGEQAEQAVIAEDADVDADAELADSETNAGDSSASSTVVAFGHRSSAVDIRPIGLASSLTAFNIQSWHIMTISLFALSVAGVATSLILTFAAKLGFLYLTPVAPCTITALLLAIDRPRTVPGTVFVIHSITLATQTALLFGVPELSMRPGSMTWIAEMSITALSLTLMMFMPMRDPLMGNGAGNDKIANLFETPTLKNRSPEDNLNLYQWMTASWMAPMISLGVSRQMNNEDVWSLPFEFQHARLYRLFHDVKGSVTARIVAVNAPDLLITSLLGIADSVLSMLPIVLLKQMLYSLEGPDAGRRVAGIYAFIICVLNIIRTQAGIFALWYTRRCYERSRGELITMIYEKTLRRKAFTFPGGTTGAEDGKNTKGAKRVDSSTSKPRVFASRGATGAAGGGGVRGGGGGMTEIANGATGGSAPASTGKILNLMRNDVYEVSQRFWEFPTLFTKPLNFFLSIYLLWRMLGASSLLGIFVIVLAQVINVFVVKYLVSWEMARRAVTDIKLQVTSQFIESIRHLRWYDWQDKWLVNILNARETELWYRVVTSLIQRLIFIINQAAAYFFPITAFYMYTVVEGLPLTIDVAFPALNLFNLLEQSLRELPDMITVLLNANVAMRRIEAFMAEPDKEGVDNVEGDVLTQVFEGELVDGIIHPPGPMVISFEEAAFAWPTAETPILSKVNLLAEGPGLTVIFGKVGTGKTALLMAMLGEMDKHSGTRHVPKETIGYCSQTPWLQSMTVRENILFCLPYDEERYNKVVEACCLLPDFAEFEAGDMSNVGENGIGLSGGQKARVALARAVYSRARILLLDDPIAALDHNTAETIMKRLFATSGLMSKRLVIFVTHRMDLAAGHADQIYEVSDEHGVVSKMDTEQVRLSVASPVAGPSKAATALGPVAEEVSDSDGPASPSDNVNTVAPSKAPKAADKVAKNKFIEEEHRSHGGVVLSVYWRYVKSGNLWLWSFAVVNFIMFRIAKIGYYYYLKIWGEAYGDVSIVGIVSRAVAPLAASAGQIVIGSSLGDDGLFSTHSALEMAAVNSTTGGLFDGQFGLPSPDENVYPWLYWFIVVSLFGMFFRSLPEFILIGITYFSGKKVFQEVMIRVSTAPFRFFDVTPVGRLMNRVTSDIGTIDGAVAQQIFRCTWFAFNWLSSILVIATATPTFLVMAVFMTVVFVIIFFKFLPASQSLRRLEMVSLSPLMSNFGTLLEGLTTVRAFRVQPHFQERIIITTDAFQRMDHFYWSLQAWLQWRFNSLSALSTFALTMTALATGLSGGLIAFVLTAAANFVNATQVLCRRYGELQMQFVSVERVTELLDLDAEPVGSIDPPAAWPSANDDIVFEDASFRYAPHLEPSLRNITMRIPAGSTVAVTGRTGSGKSTLALALLGTVLPDADEDGAVSHGTLYIGAMDVAKVNKHKLRQRISFVAQDPVLFPGSLRENLDPINEYTDEECELVLRRVLSGTSGDFALESRVDGGGKNMSQGQRQLIGLGRAVLRRSPIVILDEATASIDKMTAFLIQEVLREELRYSTVITIAHRLEAVRDADFSVVLENGRVVHAAAVEPSG